jgi:hypothetical protein
MAARAAMAVREWTLLACQVPAVAAAVTAEKALMAVGY